MTRQEQIRIIDKGGDALLKLNNEVANHLDSLELSSRTRAIIANTDIAAMAECFGGLETADEVEQFISDTYPEED